MLIQLWFTYFQRCVDTVFRCSERSSVCSDQCRFKINFSVRLLKAGLRDIFRNIRRHAVTYNYYYYYYYYFSINTLTV